jgi:hypothetical protein
LQRNWSDFFGGDHHHGRALRQKETVMYIPHTKSKKIIENL